MERGAANLESVGARSDDSKRVGAWSGDAKKARSAERRQSMERGATWKPRPISSSLTLVVLANSVYCSVVVPVITILQRPGLFNFVTFHHIHHFTRVFF